jgi:hypothetical protein
MILSKISKTKIGAISMALFFCCQLFAGSSLMAQDAPPPAPPAQPSEPPPAAPAPDGKDGEQPPPPPAPAEPAAPAEAAPVVTDDIAPEKTKEITDALGRGVQSIADLDLGSAQVSFEMAFAKCDEHGAKGALLARTYMALGALYAGYLQQVPQGTEFMKMGLGIDPKAKPDTALMSTQVRGTLNMVRESLGIPIEDEEQAGTVPTLLGSSGFWIMKHERVTKAIRMTPLGIHVETNAMVAIKAVNLYFRLPSDRNFQAIPMRQNDNMYGMLIDCDALALIDPKEIFYYLEIVGGDGSVIDRDGDLENPIQINMLEEAQFEGDPPMLPGMDPKPRCNPDEAAPCPPWDPHCKDMPCVTNEDCLGGKKCREGYCVETGSQDKSKRDRLSGPIGIMIGGGIGMGMGIVTGDVDTLKTDPITGQADNEITLGSGMSPSWMATRLMAGYYVLDNLVIGLFTRLQHINKDSSYDNTEGVDVDDRFSDDVYNMGIAGLTLQERDYLDSEWKGPMWGPFISLFLWGDGRWFGPGQVTDDEGNLADKQGFRVYSRFEFNVYGAMYHELDLCEDKYIGGNSTEQVCGKRQYVSGMEGVGLGFGALYGVHKYIDIGAELMWDIMFPDMANNFDLQLQLQFHF